MNWLLNNPIGNLYGPYFLVLFIALFAVAIGWLLYQHRTVMESDSRPPLPVPRQIDPYLFAYLRGGANELIRLGVVELLERGWLIPDGSAKSAGTKFKAIDRRPEQLDGEPLLAAIFDYFRTAKTPSNVFRTNLPQQVKDKAMSWDSWIEKENLKPSPEARFAFRFQSIFLCIALGTLGVYKLIAATFHDHNNVTILCILLASMPVTLLWLGTMGRFTDRGKQFIDDVQSALRPSLLSKDPKVKEKVESELSGSMAMPIYAMGIFGIMAIQGSELDAAYHAFEKSRSLGGSCGGGCSASSCSSASSCGGASGCGVGGGCGGGGCGGCGGG